MFLEIAGFSIAAVAAGWGLWLSCRRLEEVSHELALHYGLPEVVKGSLITAIASSFPELATAILAIPVHGEFELALGAIVGSAIFNILVIPAASAFARGAPLQTSPTLVFKEAQFYLLSVSVLMVVLCLSVIYNGNVGEGHITGTLTRGMALLPLGFYALYLFLQYQDTIEHRPTASVVRIDPKRAWGILAVCLLATTAAVEVLIQLALRLGAAFETPSFLWGLSVIAAVTSVPDLLVSLKAARNGRIETSLANVLGSNVFDLLVAVPLGVLIAGSVVVDFEQTVPMMAFLLVATIFVFALMRHAMRIGRGDAVAMLVFYGVFLGWLVLETLGVTRLLGH